MKFQIQDGEKNVVDRDLSYEEALMWIDQAFGDEFVMKLTEEDDQNDCNSL